MHVFVGRGLCGGWLRAFICTCVDEEGNIKYSQNYETHFQYAYLGLYAWFLLQFGMSSAYVCVCVCVCVRERERERERERAYLTS